MSGLGYDNPKVERVLTGVADFTRQDFLDLSAACLDQSDASGPVYVLCANAFDDKGRPLPGLDVSAECPGCDQCREVET